MENNALVKIALDGHNKVSGKYSVSDSQEVLRQELVALNGGSTVLDYRHVRENGPALFRILEEILTVTTNDGLKGNEFFMQMVDSRNIALGDDINFYTDEKALFYVANVANGTQGVSRQRLNAGTTTTVNPTLKAIKVYEELNRVLAGRVDFNHFIDVVSRSFTKKILDDIYATISSLANNTTYYPSAGSYSEANLLTLIDHVEADTGKKATLFGTRSALRNITMTNLADSAKEDQYNLGYYGNFFGTKCVCVPQVHEANSDNFKLSNKQIFVIASDDKPIKYVTEGQSLIIPGNSLNNADLTQEYLMGQSYGVGLIASDKFGVYTLS